MYIWTHTASAQLSALREIEHYTLPGGNALSMCD